MSEITGVSSLSNYKTGTVTWIKKPKAVSEDITRKFSLVITCQNSGVKAQKVIEVQKSKETFFAIIKHFFALKAERVISKDSIVETERIGINVSTGHRCYINKDVEIGVNTCIDHGTIDDTKIGDSVKIDNLCHIAHNVVIKKFNDYCVVYAGRECRHTRKWLYCTRLPYKELGYGWL